MDKSIYREEYRKLIEQLVQARKEAGLKQSDLAKKIGLSQQDVSKYENFIRRLDVIEFLEICAHLKLDYRAALEISYRDIVSELKRTQP